MNLAKFKFGLGALVVFGASSALIVEHQAREKLGAANESLTQQFAQLKADNETLSNLAAQAKKSESLPDGRLDELVRLRGEVGMLRQQTNELAGLQQENQKLLSRVAAQSEPADQLSAADQFTLRQTHVQNALNTLLAAVKSYAANHNGQTPASFDQLTASGELAATNFPGNLGLDDFEFMKAGTVDMQGRKLVLRNRIPMPRPEGDSVWVYGSIDGSGGIISTPANYANFDPGPTPASPPPNQ
jgi:hypothetical protein